MLYKTLQFVGAVVYGLNTISDAAVYNASALDNGLSSWTCSDATTADTCNFRCNVQQWGQDIHCGVAKQCNIYVEEKKCFENSFIDASAANRLYVHPSIADQPYSGATFHVPSSGAYPNAYFLKGDSEMKQTYASITIQAGPNTHRINLDCRGGDEKDNCKKAEINAEDANILYINTRGAEFNGQDANNPITVHCPQNSAYVGVYPAPCYIKATGGGYIENVIIHTLYGQPHDVFIAVDDPSMDLSNVQLTCSALDPSLDGAWDAAIFDNANSVCFNSKTPTDSPTKTPSHSPSKTPSYTPTRVPSINPSKYPTHNPTKIPTKSPSYGPTRHPSVSPSRYPSAFPSVNPSINPTGSPSVFPSDNPSMNPTLFTTEDIVSTALSVPLISGVGSTLSMVLIGLVVLVVCAVCVLIILYVKHRQKMHRVHAMSLAQVSLKNKSDGSKADVVPKESADDSAAAPADDTMNVAKSAPEGGHGGGGMVVIRVSSAPQRDQMKVGVLNGFEPRQKPVMDLVYGDEKEDAHMDEEMIAIGDLTAGHGASMIDDIALGVSADSDDVAILDDITAGGLN